MQSLSPEEPRPRVYPLDPREHLGGAERGVILQMLVLQLRFKSGDPFGFVRWKLASARWGGC